MQPISSGYANLSIKEGNRIDIGSEEAGPRVQP